LGPPEHVDCLCPHQEGIGLLVSSGRWGRLRRCLLKGCGRLFRPSHPLSRYCSPACRQAARCWSRWRAAREYRQSEAGREQRREQARRYRARRAAGATACAVGAKLPCEGHHKPPGEKISCCARPGCYVLFVPCCGYVPQKFCSGLCRQALRVVRVREARWRARLLGAAGGSGSAWECGP